MKYDPDKVKKRYDEIADEEDRWISYDTYETIFRIRRVKYVI